MSLGALIAAPQDEAEPRLLVLEPLLDLLGHVPFPDPGMMPLDLLVREQRLHGPLSHPVARGPTERTSTQPPFSSKPPPPLVHPTGVSVNVRTAALIVLFGTWSSLLKSKFTAVWSTNPQSGPNFDPFA